MSARAQHGLGVAKRNLRGWKQVHRLCEDDGYPTHLETKSRQGMAQGRPFTSATTGLGGLGKRLR